MEIETLDILHVNVMSVEAPNNPGSIYRLKIMFMNQPVLVSNVTSTMTPIILRGKRFAIAHGEFPFDVKEFEYICWMVNQPLIVTIEPIAGSSAPSSRNTSGTVGVDASTNTRSSEPVDISFCNVDLLPVICGNKKVHVKKRLEPSREPKVLLRKSWCNLPLITLELYIERNEEMRHYHDKLTNSMTAELTVFAAYNLPWEDDSELCCTVASELPVIDQKDCTTLTFEGSIQKKSNLNQYIDWECIRQEPNTLNAKSDKTNSLKLNVIKNASTFNLEKYMTGQQQGTVEWSSFHRSLLGRDGGELSLRLRKLKWPLELRARGELNCMQFMALVDLSSLLYPGERSIVTTSQLWWYNPEAMLLQTGCQPLLPPEASKLQKTRSLTKKIGSAQELTSDSTDTVPVCGADGEPAFVLLEFSLSRPLVESCVPPHVTDSEMHRMLSELEEKATPRVCTGRGAGESWNDCVKRAAGVLAHSHTSGTFGLCSLSRQLGTSHRQVELHTSILKHAAPYINENFVIKENYSEKEYKEMLLMAHTCLMREAKVALEDKKRLATAPAKIRVAARSARQLADYQHAERLFLECVALEPKEAGSWRELGTCLLDSAPDRARICFRRALVLDPRHHLTYAVATVKFLFFPEINLRLLSLGSMVWQESPADAEIFFSVLVALHPTWLGGCIAAHCYYLSVGQFLIADVLLEVANEMTSQPREREQTRFPREWTEELGDWWEPTSFVDSYSPFLDTADLLLRLRSLDLAELCLAQHQIAHGESAAYLHLLALCFYLRGDHSNALCHAENAILTYDETCYLLALAGACLLKQGNLAGARAAYTSATHWNAISPDTQLRAAGLFPNKMRARNVLQLLVGKRPCAQAWLALACNLVAFNEYQEAEMCCVAALDLDRRAAVAWAVLARLLARRGCRTRANFCQNMADYSEKSFSEGWDDFSGPASSAEELIAELVAACACQQEDDVEIVSVAGDSKDTF